MGWTDFWILVVGNLVGIFLTLLVTRLLAGQVTDVVKIIKTWRAPLVGAVDEQDDPLMRAASTVLPKEIVDRATVILPQVLTLILDKIVEGLSPEQDP